MYDVSLETILSYAMCSGTRLNREPELLIHNHNYLSLKVGHAIRDFLSPLKDARARHLLFTYGNLVTPRRTVSDIIWRIVVLFYQ